MLFKDYSTKYGKSFIWSLSAFLFDNLGSIFKKYKINNKNKPKRILVIRKDEIGDSILSIPMYESIKKTYPKSHLSVLVGKPAASLLEGNPYIDEIISIETIRSSKKSFILQYFNLIDKLKKEKFDLAIDPKGSILNVLLMYLIKAKDRISYWNVSGGKPLLTLPVTYKEEEHDINANLHLLNAYGIKSANNIPKIYFSSSDRKNAEPFLKILPKEYCCVYMTPTSVYKSWPDDRWKSLFSMFPEVNFVIMARESEREVLESKFKEIKNAKILCADKLKTVALIFSKAKSIVSVDGGMLHLAWISNPKTIALFGQVDLKLLKPLRGKVICYCPESEQGFNRKPIESTKINKYMIQISPKEVGDYLLEYLR